KQARTKGDDMYSRAESVYKNGIGLADENPISGDSPLYYESQYWEMVLLENQIWTLRQSNARGNFATNRQITRLMNNFNDRTTKLVDSSAESSPWPHFSRAKYL